MRLAEFITTQRERIMAEWETFARDIGTVSATMDIAALRDHASEMLTVIAADLETPQTGAEQHEKSIGQGPDGDEAPSTAAEQHGADRAERGFSIDEMVSEYRALRASVIRLWIEEKGALDAGDIADLTRFNEAIDQSLTESIARYTHDLDQSKEMFIAILGHDLRTPLGAIITSATFMLDIGELQEPHLTLTSRIASSSRRMDRMVGDLLDLTRSRLGGGIPIERGTMNLDEVVRDVASELGTMHTDRSIRVRATGDLDGRWDRERLSQALTNLIGNALEHGAQETPVEVTVQGGSDDVAIVIHNHGVPIPASLIRRIFDPMKRRAATGPRAAGATSHLGLGLYIAERIVTAHSGTIDVESSASAGTTFTVRLPRAT
jgi:signal transduction histidine kinase